MSDSLPLLSQTIPFYNYPTFVNLFTSFAFIVVSFAYIFPVQRKAMTVTPDQVAVPKRVFVIMGALDGVCGIIQVPVFILIRE